MTAYPEHGRHFVSTEGVSDFMIRLTLGKAAKISARDYARVSAQKWYARRGRGGSHADAYYAVNKQNVLMHRYIMRAKKGQLVDHIDGNGLNNTRENLRIATVAENNANRRLRKPTPNHYKGIWGCKSGWYALVNVRGNKIKGAVWPTKEEAARDYDKIKKMVYGEFACTNEEQELYSLTPDQFFKRCIMGKA